MFRQNNILAKHHFSYSLFTLSETMLVGARELPFAVIVESDDGAFVVGLTIKPLTMSGVSQALVEALPDALSSQLEEARLSGGKLSIIDTIAAHYQWNIHLSPVKTIESERSLQEVSYDLFANHILSRMPPEYRPKPARTPQPHREEMFDLALARA